MLFIDGWGQVYARQDRNDVSSHPVRSSIREATVSRKHHHRLLPVARPTAQTANDFDGNSAWFPAEAVARQGLQASRRLEPGID